MIKREEVQRSRGAQGQRTNTILVHPDKIQDYEVNSFLYYTMRLPRSLMRQLLPYVNLIKNQLNSSRFKETINQLFKDLQQRYQPIPNSDNLIFTISKMLNLKSLDSLFKKNYEKIEAQRKKPILSTVHNDPGKRDSFEKLMCIHPDYEYFYRLSKQEKKHSITHHDVKAKERSFHTESRFVTRFDEFLHYRSQEKHKNKILYLQYAGNKIIGKKSYAVLNNKAIEIWQKISKEFPMNLMVSQLNQQENTDNGDKRQSFTKGEGSFGLSCKLLGHTQKVTCASFSSDQYYLITGSVDRTVKVWCLRLKVLVAEHKAHLKTVWDVQFSPSGYYFVSGSADGTMILWKTDVPNPQRVYLHSQRKDVYKVAFGKDNSFVLSAGEDKTVKIWNTMTAQLLREFFFATPVINCDLGFSGCYLLACEFDGRITIFDLGKGQVVNWFYFKDPSSKKKQKKPSSEKQVQKKARIFDLCLSEDEKQLACVAGKFLMLYSMQRLQKKVTKNIFSIYDIENLGEEENNVVPKQVIYMGIQTHLNFCSYVNKNLLVVGGKSKRIQKQ